MAKKFKDYYNTDCARIIADKLVPAYPDFEKQSFINHIKKNIRNKEFLERQDVFADALDKYLTPDYKKNVSILNEILGDELETTEGMFTFGWWLWPIGRYIERNGTKDFSSSVKFIYELTKRFTGEFAIRPLLEKFPKKTLNIMLKWSKDQNVHVRRLASEGVRIRLPWAKKLLIAIDEFEIYKQILTNLKNDKEKFVQKSVGNNINDLMKVDSKLANLIIDEWLNESPTKETLWIIKHGRRSLKKLQ